MNERTSADVRASSGAGSAFPVPSREQTEPATQEAPGAVEVDNLSLYYGAAKALDEISIVIPENKITAFIGPSGCGKSTLLRCFNRLNDLIPSARIEGDVRVGGRSIYSAQEDVQALRKHVGMVFQKSNPFPRSIYENVAYGCRLQGLARRSELDDRVEDSLRRASLWDEVKDRLDDSALGLSGGQQQRLCIARTIATQPRIVLYDEPCSALDPIATAHIEELMADLEGQFTQIVVTHNMQQASRVSDFTAFLYLGELIEFGPTEQIFLKPRKQETEDYITGRFG